MWPRYNETRDTVVISFFSIFIEHEFDKKLTTIYEGDNAKK